MKKIFIVLLTLLSLVATAQNDQWKTAIDSNGNIKMLWFNNGLFLHPDSSTVLTRPKAAYQLPGMFSWDSDSGRLVLCIGVNKFLKIPVSSDIGAANGLNADSIRHLFADTTGMKNGWQLLYNVQTNTYQFSQANRRETYLGVLYAKKNPPAGDFTAFGTATVGTAANGKTYITGGSGFGSGAVLSSYGVTRLPKWKFFIRIIDSVLGFGNGPGIKSTNGYVPQHLASRMDMSAAAGCQSYVYLGTNLSSLTQVATSSTSTNPTVHDTVDMTMELKDDTVYFTAFNRTKNILNVMSYPFNLWNPTAFIVPPNTGNFADFNFGGTHYIDSISITSRVIKNAQLAIGIDSKGTGLLDSVYSLSLPVQLNQYYPTTINFSRGSDRSTEIISDTTEIWALSPKQWFLQPISNDLRSGMSQATSTANFLILYNALIRHGIKVVLAYPFFENSVDQSGQISMLETNFPTQPKLDYWNPIKSDTTRFLSNGLSDRVHPNRYAIDTCVKQTLLQNIIEGGQNLSAYIQANPQVPQIANMSITGTGNINGNITTQGAIFAGNTSVASGAALFDAQISPTIRFRAYNAGSKIGIGAFNNALTAATEYDITGAPIVFFRQQSSTASEIARFDTSTTALGRVGTFLVGRTSIGSTDAPIQVSTPGQFGYSMTTTGSNGIALEMRTPGAVNYIGTGNFVTGAAAADIGMRAHSTGKIFFGYGTSGTYMANFDNGVFNLGSATSAASAILNVTSTTQGALLPRMTTTQQNAISSPATGLLLFNTDSIAFMLYTGSAWVKIGGTGGGGSNPPFSDALDLVMGSVNNTKLLKINLSNISSASRRTWTAQDTSGTVAFLNVGQTWTQAQDFRSGTILVPTLTAHDSAGSAANTLYVDRAVAQKYPLIQSHFATGVGTGQGQGYSDGIGGEFLLSCWLNYTNAGTSAVINVTFNYTDYNNNLQTVTLYPIGSTSPNVGTVGYYYFQPILVKAKGGTITMAINTVQISGGVNTMVYDWGSTLQQLTN